MKETVFNRRLADIKRAIEKVDPANGGFTGSGLAEYLNSPYDGPPRKGTNRRKLNSREMQKEHDEQIERLTDNG
ncbi:hypothetical protein LCGC14_2297920 [marine sediment metagenome]|uniref:Uncharacterized protein n=1 Tax=marine sediment metagenome TaxID=412755 RepID=A0A0F9FJC7_9ZZZZ